MAVRCTAAGLSESSTCALHNDSRRTHRYHNGIRRELHIPEPATGARNVFVPLDCL